MISDDSLPALEDGLLQKLTRIYLINIPISENVCSFLSLLPGPKTKDAKRGCTNLCTGAELLEGFCINSENLLNKILVFRSHNSSTAF